MFGDSNGTGIAADNTHVYLTTPGRLYIGQYKFLMDTGGIAPTVKITSPQVNETVVERSTISIVAEAEDDVQVVSVNLIINGERSATALSFPYVFNYTVPVGISNLSISAEAVDLAGSVGTANDILVNVIPDPKTTVVGKVLDEAGSPVANATVTTNGGLSSVTLADGTFSIIDVQTVLGNIIVKAGNGMLLGKSAGQPPVVGGITDVGDLIVKPYIIINTPLNGITAIEETSIMISANTTAGIPISSVSFKVNGVVVYTNTGPAPYAFQYTVPVGANTLTIVAEATDTSGDTGRSNEVTVNVIPDPGTTVTGRVIDEAGSPVEGAAVTANGGTTSVTGIDGAFSITGVPTISGDIIVNARKGFFAGKSAAVPVVSGGITDAGDITIKQYIRLTSPSNSAVLVEGEYITVSVDVNQYIVTDSIRFFINGQEFSPNMFRPYEVKYRVPSNTTSLVIEASGLDINGKTFSTGNHIFPVIFDPLTQVTGTVVDSLGNPVRGSFVELRGSLLKTGVDGKFLFEQVQTLRDINIQGSATIKGNLSRGFGRAQPLRGGVTDIGAIQLKAFSGTEKTYQSGVNPSKVKKGNINNDNIIDLVVIDAASRSVSCLLGKENGGFSSAITSRFGEGYPHDFEMDDLDGNGFDDLVMVSISAGAPVLEIFSGNGDGTFQSPQTQILSANPSVVTTGDLNGDGFFDIVVAYSTSPMISTFLGNSDGTFVPSINLTVTGRALQVQLIDINGDTNLDLLTLSGGNNGLSYLSVFLGNGDNSFQLQGVVSPGRYLNSMDIADLNADGFSDVALLGTTSIVTILGNGDGTFQTPITNNSCPHSCNAMAINDFNNDAIADMFITGNSINAEFFIFFGRGDGTFNDTFTVAGNLNEGTSVISEDFNNDGFSDAAFTNAGLGGNLVVLLGGLNGQFQSSKIESPTGFVKPNAAVMEDWNGDTIKDLAILRSFYVNQFSVFLGDETGGFSLLGQYDTAYQPEYLNAGDLDGDNHLDLVVVGGGYPYRGDVRVYKGDGTGAFSPVLNSGISWEAYSNIQDIVIEDVDLDGNLDIAAADAGLGKIRIFYGNGDGTFQSGIEHGVGKVSSINVKDVNGDGLKDIVGFVKNSNASRIVVLISLGNRIFQTPHFFMGGNEAPATSAVEDLNDDGAPDLIVLNNGDSTLSVHLNDGHGLFNSPAFYPVGSGPFVVETKDLNNDNFIDLIVGNRMGDVSVLLNKGDGAFEEPQHFNASGSIMISMAIEDRNKDNILDIIVTSEEGISVLFGFGDGTF